MMGVVVDANVYISALVFGGGPEQALDSMTSRGLKLYISQSIMDEVAGTLIEKFDWSHRDVQELLPLCGSAASSSRQISD